jgi:hypothetical protein
MKKRKYMELERVSEKFKALVSLYVKKNIEQNALKAVTVAQWLYESDFGNSELFMKYNNACNIKYRPDLEPYGQDVHACIEDGLEGFTSFDSLNSFIDGYWATIDRGPYAGWRKTKTPLAFLKHISSPDTEYAAAVLALAPIAEKLLVASRGDKKPKKEFSTIKVFNTGLGIIGVIVYIGDKEVSSWRGTDARALADFIMQHPSVSQIIMADITEVWPGLITLPSKS